MPLLCVTSFDSSRCDLQHLGDLFISQFRVRALVPCRLIIPSKQPLKNSGVACRVFPEISASTDGPCLFFDSNRNYRKEVEDENQRFVEKTRRHSRPWRS